MKYSNLIEDLGNFFKEIEETTNQLNLNTDGLVTDHIGLKLSTAKQVESLIDSLPENSEVLSDSVVGGRIIYIIKLKEPIRYKGYEIPCLEIPYPKPDHNYPMEGLQHIEFVLPNTTHQTNEYEKAFLYHYNKTKKDFKKFNYEFEIPQVEDPREEPNYTVSIQDPESKYEIKFHPKSIEDILNRN